VTGVVEGQTVGERAEEAVGKERVDSRRQVREVTLPASAPPALGPPAPGASAMVSTFDLFRIGVGPSSSHTVGPMRAAALFARAVLEGWAGFGSGARRADGTLPGRLRVELFGSLGATGIGHGSDRAVLAGLEGADPETVDPEALRRIRSRVETDGVLSLLGRAPIRFRPERDLVFHRRRQLPGHPNGMVFVFFRSDDAPPFRRQYFSIGGGFLRGDGIDEPAGRGEPPFPFHSGTELLQRCEEAGKSVSEVVRANERLWRSDAEIRSGLRRIWAAMDDCVRRGCETDGLLPGSLGVRRRAAGLCRALLERGTPSDPLVAFDWLDAFAVAVNEENAAGGRVVTAPTNGAAGVVPAVLSYYVRFWPGADDRGVERFLLAAAAIGAIIKENASISGAEIGCQGEVGSACAMAAAGLVDAVGGTPAQVENAAEIGIEHNLGLTCDPVGGLVQIPCIERNAMAAVKALNAARLALRGDGHHLVSLDRAVATMRATGQDMKVKYKETSRGGLAVNVVEC